mmetsp:Transcript_1533/g.4094  ORF Transcript_1533/g.4094 Transcript_1533/m.4094 type:complete len:221 (+) Transcript_1533:2-664(+)
MRDCAWPCAAGGACGGVDCPLLPALLLPPPSSSAPALIMPSPVSSTAPSSLPSADPSSSPSLPLAPAAAAAAAWSVAWVPAAAAPEAPARPPDDDADDDSRCASSCVIPPAPSSSRSSSSCVVGAIPSSNWVLNGAAPGVAAVAAAAAVLGSCAAPRAARCARDHCSSLMPRCHSRAGLGMMVVLSPAAKTSDTSLSTSRASACPGNTSTGAGRDSAPPG